MRLDDIAVIYALISSRGHKCHAPKLLEWVAT